MDLVTIFPEDFLKFKKSETGHSLSATIEIFNKTESEKVVYKVKTTSPKLFVVKPP
jgi:hypothetical protein